MDPNALLSVLAAAALTLASCTGKSDSNPTPRPEAFPRIEVPDSEFTPVDSIPFRFEANSSATVSVKRRPATDDRWITIAYPSLGVTVYCTATRTTGDDNLHATTDNRAMRIALNVGDNPTEQIDVASPSGFSGAVFVTPSGTITPVQFLTAGPGGWVVSGSATLRQAPAPARADSIRPIVDALRRDMIHALKTLSPEP